MSASSYLFDSVEGPLASRENLYWFNVLVVSMLNLLLIQGRSIRHDLVCLFVSKPFLLYPTRFTSSWLKRAK